MYLPPYFRPIFGCTPVVRLLVIALGITFSEQAKSQTEQIYFGSHTIQATQLCKEENFDEAITHIELAILDSVDSSDFFTWYSRGFIYKEVYKKRESENPQSKYREIAVNSFLKSRVLAGNTSEQTDNHDLALKFLANTYYNDALHATLRIDQNNTNLGNELVERYCDIMQTIHKAEECPLAFAAYYRAKGQRFHELWTTDENNKTLWDLAIANYRRALELAQHDCSISYNIAALYCNLLVTYRNNPGAATPEVYRELLHESELSITSSLQDCVGDMTYAELITQAQKLLTDIQLEFNAANPSSGK